MTTMTGATRGCTPAWRSSASACAARLAPITSSRTRACCPSAFDSPRWRPGCTARKRRDACRRCSPRTLPPHRRAPRPSTSSTPSASCRKPPFPRTFPTRTWASTWSVASTTGPAESSRTPASTAPPRMANWTPRRSSRLTWTVGSTPRGSSSCAGASRRWVSTAWGARRWRMPTARRTRRSRDSRGS